jgi:hypothetical protein
LWGALAQGRLLTEAPQHGYWPFIVLGVILVEASVLVTLFILGPLWIWKRQGLRSPGAGSYAGYFGCLGLGYIMVELALMQKFALVLGDPIYSLSVVLGGMLLFTGIGSYGSGAIGQVRQGRVLMLALGVAACLAVLYVASDKIVGALLGRPFIERAAGVVAVLAPLSILLGFFFPLGIRVVERRAQAFVPWAWAINGGFTVIGAVLTVMLALSTGFVSVLAVAGILYLLAAAFLVAGGLASDGTA